MKEYSQSIEEVLSGLNASAEGLTSAEAEQRLAKYGPNRLEAGKKESLLKRFLDQLRDPMTIILLAAALVSGFLSVYEGMKGEGGFPADTVIILAVVLINAILGVIQESKAESAIEALQQLSSATSKVLRDGRQVTLKSENLVPGDVIILEAGDSVPADGRIIECASFKAEESALTGESLPVEKHDKPISADKVPLGDRKNMVYTGSAAVYGRARAVVTGTGMHTEMGKIAGALSSAVKQKTPLQHKLTQLSRVLTYLVLGICAVIFAISLLRADSVSFAVVIDTFMVAVSLAVAAIPEGLSTVVTIVLSIGVTNLSRRSAIIRKMTAVETLGCTRIICSDKTGTLTQNRMTVVDKYTCDEKLLANAMSLCSDAELDAQTGLPVGEPTEAALVAYAYGLGLDKNDEKQRLPRVSELPFDSLRKLMTTIHKTGDGGFIQYTKGAPDVVISRCTACLTEEGVKPLSNEIREKLMSENKRMADGALRVLAAAYKPLNELPRENTSESVETDLIFIGLTGMIDPVRPEVKPAIDECRSAGIRPIMITGDHKDTAVAIALQLGIISSRDEAITGAELDGLSDGQFETEVEKYSVYARVQPEHKTRIVNAWQKKGCVTAMTGDGVNDAPSIKNADIGVGMGITGTDVTKNAADMILADDNFATIVSAVGEGRRIYDNIRKAIQFLLTSNLSEVLIIFFATMLGFTIFKAPHLLWINLITDCFPALALGTETAEEGIMKREPRPTREGVFAGGMGAAIGLQGLIITAITFLSYYIGSAVNPLTGTTMAFVTLSLCEIAHSFNMRSLSGSLFKLKGLNKWLIGAAVLSFICTVLVVELPFMAKAFGFEMLSLPQYLTAFGLALTIIPFTELYKLAKRALTK